MTNFAFALPRPALLSSLFALVVACGGESTDSTGTGVAPPYSGTIFGANPSQTEDASNTDSSSETNQDGSNSNDSEEGSNSNSDTSSSTNSEGQPDFSRDDTQSNETGSSDAANSNTTEPNTTEPDTVDPDIVEAVASEDRLLVPPTQGTPNLFTEVLGVTEREVDEKLILAVNRIFGIGTNESATPVVNEGYRLYYELPQDPSIAFIWAPDSADIRSEGMSYGMMVAVQMDMQDEFNKLWKYAQTFMEFDGNGDPWQYYLSWRGAVNTGNPNNWTLNYAAQDGPAPDGEEYFAAALYLANRRWGSSQGVDYLGDASNLSAAMLNNPSGGGRTPVIDRGSNMVVFYPSGNSANFSDPSYHLPAFYEIFAQDGPPGDANRWRQMAEVSRQYFVSSADNNTGLHPDYANFNGTPNAGGDRHDEFRFDAWRVIMNMAVDASWSGQDARLTQQVDKYYDFFSTRLDGSNVANQTFALNGTNAAGGGSTALTSTLATGALATDHPMRERYIDNAWNVAQQTGEFRYYQEMVYILGLLSTGGMYGYQWN